jgi:uncharacterized protein (DUF433 family)
MDWRERISINPKVCGGIACIHGTRVMVSVILDNLAEGESDGAIMEGYHITREDIQAAIAFAADLAADRHIRHGRGPANCISPSLPLR